MSRRTNSNAASDHDNHQRNDHENAWTRSNNFSNVTGGRSHCNDQYQTHHHSSSVELTQDCCVAWDESHNVDLRLLARSPLMPSTPALLATPRSHTSRSSSNSTSTSSSATTPRQVPTTPSSRHHVTTAAANNNNNNNNNTTSTSFTLDSLKRQLHPPTVASTTTTTTTTAATRTNSEHEIDGILQVLQRQDDTTASGGGIYSQNNHANNNHTNPLKRSASYPPSGLSSKQTQQPQNLRTDVHHDDVPRTRHQHHHRRRRRGQKRPQDPSDQPIAKRPTNLVSQQTLGRDRHYRRQAGPRPSSTHSLPATFTTTTPTSSSMPLDFDSLLQELDAPQRPPHQDHPPPPPPQDHPHESDTPTPTKRPPLQDMPHGRPPPPTSTSTTTSSNPQQQRQQCQSSSPSLLADNHLMQGGAEPQKSSSTTAKENVVPLPSPTITTSTSIPTTAATSTSLSQERRQPLLLLLPPRPTMQPPPIANHDSLVTMTTNQRKGSQESTVLPHQLPQPQPRRNESTYKEPGTDINHQSYDNKTRTDTHAESGTSRTEPLLALPQQYQQQPQQQYQQRQYQYPQQHQYQQQRYPAQAMTLEGSKSSGMPLPRIPSSDGVPAQRRDSSMLPCSRDMPPPRIMNPMMSHVSNVHHATASQSSRIIPTILLPASRETRNQQRQMAPPTTITDTSRNHNAVSVLHATVADMEQQIHGGGVDHSNMARQIPSTASHPLTAAVASVSVTDAPHPPSTTTVGTVELQDEFGDITFSNDDWDNLDSLILAATTQPTEQQEANVTACVPSRGTTTINHNSLVAQQYHVPAKQHQLQRLDNETSLSHLPIVEAEKKNDVDFADDQFDDFPSIDFEALDQQIAESRTAVPTNRSLANDSRNSTGYHVPAADAIVRNPLATGSFADNSSKLAFLTFSRYTVLTVECDTVTYTKTLVVSSWESDSSYDERSSKWLHRSELLEQSVGAVQTRHGWIPRKVLEAPAHGCIHLRGEWYHTSVDRGDTIHLCSLEGKYRTDAAALPVILHTCPPQGSDLEDDLVLAIHPDELLFPSTISEAVTCSRRAVIRARLGSSGINAKAPLLGTLRHECFERCIQSQDFSLDFAKDVIHKIVTKNAEALVGCGINRMEAEQEVLRVLPQFQMFANEYTSFARSNRVACPPTATVEGLGFNPPMRFVADRVLGVEETIVSPELGVKGSVDVLVQATTELLLPGKTQPSHGKTTSRMSIELKTGFKQGNNNTHAAQLAFYAVMLRARYGSQRKELSNCASTDVGAAEGGMLLYINHESLLTQHVTPMVNEIKSLIGQRNLVASELLRASSPRGLVLAYDDGESNSKILRPELLPAPPSPLPEMLPMSQLCKMCYARRECTMYAAAESAHFEADNLSNVVKSHGPLLQQYTGHLDDQDMAYFLEWDRLVDLEIDACSTSSAAAWLVGSAQRERSTGLCLSSLVLAAPRLSSDLLSDGTLVFERSTDGNSQSSFPTLDLEPGCYVIVSTDASLSDISNAQAVEGTGSKRFRHHLYLVRGTLVKADSSSITIHSSHNDAERALAFVRESQEMGHQVRFRLDKDIASFGTGTLRQNLINFFTRDGEPPETPGKSTVRYDRRLPWLRDMVVRLTPPTFERNIKKSLFSSVQGDVRTVPGCDMMDLALEFSELNPDQQAAVEKAMAANDYALIQGLPGTGKTSTIAFVARLFAAHGKKVLITSYTHAAVDNVLLKLMESGLASSKDAALVRVGNRSACHAVVQSILAPAIASKIANGCPLDVPTLSASDEEPVSPDDLANVMAAARIVGVTALTIPRSALLANLHFDVVIVDEAGQISQPAILGSIMAADKFILVGDHQQLPPLVQSELAEKGGYGVSMLKRLADAHPSAIAQLTLQYRMHEDICLLSNELVYGGKLKCANDQVRTQLLQLNHFPQALPQTLSSTYTPWLFHAVDPERPVMFVDTDKIRTSADNGSTVMHELESSATRQRGGNIVNETEAMLIQNIVQALVSSGLEASAIGIVTPFRAQLRVFEEKGRIRQLKGDGLEVSTIDRYQGRDKRAIVISFVRSNIKGRVGRLLSDPRRLNVAMTRAKCKLIMVGSFSTLLKGSDMLRPVLEGIRSRSQVLELPENALMCYSP